MSREAFANNFWCAGILQVSRAQTIETQNRSAIRFIDGQECLCCAALVALASVLLEEHIELGFAAVKGIAVVLLGDRLFSPIRQTHERSRSARAALRSFAFAGGGFSRSSITSRLS